MVQIHGLNVNKRSLEQLAQAPQQAVTSPQFTSMKPMRKSLVYLMRSPLFLVLVTSEEVVTDACRPEGGVRLICGLHIPTCKQPPR